MDNLNINNKAIRKLLGAKITDQTSLMRIKRKVAKEFGISILENSDIIREYRRLVSAGKIDRLPLFERIIRKRAVRTLSGIAPVAVLTKPYPCPGNCAYCPSEKDVPRVIPIQRTGGDAGDPLRL